MDRANQIIKFFILGTLLIFVSRLALPQEAQLLPPQMNANKASEVLSAQPLADTPTLVLPVAEIGVENIDYSVFVDTQESRFTLGVYTQISQFEIESRSLIGSTFEVMAGYAILPKLSISLGIAQAVDISNGVSILFTGIRSSMSYMILGEAYKRSSILNVNGRSTISFLSGLRPTLSTDIGVDQYLFNGSTRVTPATGLSLGLKFDHALWILRMSWMARYGSLIIDNTNVSLMTVGAGLLYRF